jgi:hypothetical protein
MRVIITLDTYGLMQGRPGRHTASLQQQCKKRTTETVAAADMRLILSGARQVVGHRTGVMHHRSDPHTASLQECKTAQKTVQSADRHACPDHWRKTVSKPSYKA